MATYTDYKLDASGDRAIENGSFVIVEDAEVIKQQMETNLKLSKKDWFLNFDEGILFFDNDAGIMGAKTITTAQEGQLIAASENTLGVISLNKFELDLGQTELVVDIEALTEFGVIELEVTL
jgi:hypothetical protein